MSPAESKMPPLTGAALLPHGHVALRPGVVIHAINGVRYTGSVPSEHCPKKHRPAAEPQKPAAEKAGDK